jgi:carbamoyl-phosphate synthase large subunit
VIVTIGGDFFLSVARDKYHLDVFLADHPQFKRIITCKINELHVGMKFPLIAKPKNGRSSEGIYYLQSLNDLNKNVNPDHYIFQEVIEGPIFDVDYVRSRITGNDFALPRKELLRTRNGAGMTVQTVESEQLQQLACYIGKELDIIGCINFEFILNNDEYYLMDINPRFSAGIGFSKLAGYDFVKSHVQCFLDQDIDPQTKYRCLIMEKRMYEVINQIM